MLPGATAGICEDDDELRGVLRDALEREGFTVRATALGGEAVRMFTERPPDVLILDVGLPDADGRDVCQALRAHGVTAPVLFLTARDAVSDRVSGFSAGGDDYLSKPFALAELLARIGALRKRAAPPADPAPAGLQLDPSAHAVSFLGAEIALTPTEFRIMAALAATPGGVVRRATLIAAAWPDGAIVHSNTLDTYLKRVRRKLRMIEAPQAIETLRGVGYRLR
ncbi:MAG: hypothetical protein QOF76_3772 [Solirubrobacteraceae bacterium]|jgi:two-component system response regulator MprA|nr:hypothetical protein [Solirubrobacteraceae bacterium]